MSPEILKRLGSLSGLAGTTSDILDDLGWHLAVPASSIQLRTSGRQAAVGHAITLRYLPRRAIDLNSEERQSGLSLDVLGTSQAGDVLVIDASGFEEISVLGGLAALRAATRGLSGVIVEGGIRDVDEIDAIPIWSRALTPITGKWRVEVAGVNEPVFCGGVQVHPGDLVIADMSGICFVPGNDAPGVAERIVSLWEKESMQMRSFGSAVTEADA